MSSEASEIDQEHCDFFVEPVWGSNFPSQDNLESENASLPSELMPTPM
jgi:hypothetical protein